MTDYVDDYSRLLKKAEKLKKPTVLPKKGKLIGKKKILSKKHFVNARQLKEKKNNAEYLVNIIVLALFIHRWIYQERALKYSSKKYNKKRANLKKFIKTIIKIYYKHKYYIDEEIFNILKKLPPRKGVKHDPRFWKLRLVNNEVLDSLAQKRLKFWAKLNFIMLANRSIYEMTIAAVDKLKEKYENEEEEEEEEEKKIEDNRYKSKDYNNNLKGKNQVVKNYIKEEHEEEEGEEEEEEEEG